MISGEFKPIGFSSVDFNDSGVEGLSAVRRLGKDRHGQCVFVSINKAKTVCPPEINDRPTLQNVGLLAFLRGIFRGLHALSQSQTLPGALSLTTQV